MVKQPQQLTLKQKEMDIPHQRYGVRIGLMFLTARIIICQSLQMKTVITGLVKIYR